MIEEPRRVGYTFGMAAVQRSKKHRFPSFSLVFADHNCFSIYSTQVSFMDPARSTCCPTIVVLPSRSSGEQSRGKLAKRQDPTASGPSLMHPRLLCKLARRFTLEQLMHVITSNYSVACRGLLPPAGKVKATAGPHDPYNIDTIKPRTPAFSMGRKYVLTPLSRSPGPIYYVKLPRPTPAFSFGTKHSICAPPYITECDEKC